LETRKNNDMTIGFGFLGDLPLTKTIEYTGLAEKKGFDSAWVAEEYYLRDAMVTITAMASSTFRLKLAMGVVNPYTRNPALAAMSLTTLNEIANGRVIFGLGSSAKVWIEDQMGIPMGNRLKVMREYITILRDLLNGNKVTFSGEYFKFKDVALRNKPVYPHVPIYVAAVGPRMLQLAGEIADGVVLTSGNSPEYVRYAVKQLAEGAKKANRDVSEIDVASYVIYSVNEDRKKAMDESRYLIAYVLSPPEYGNLLCEVSGMDPKSLDPVREAFSEGYEANVDRFIDDMFVNTFSASGRPDDCRRRLQEYMDAGVNTPVVMPVGGRITEAMDSLGPLLNARDKK
jgi:5,10-methylenetetrahydromethanopterin reductase